jgi:hypothetical protein
MAAVSNRKQACRGGAERDDGQEERREGIETETRAQPGDAERERDGRWRLGDAEQRKERDHQQRR